jgi:hypothetical protein
MNSTQTAKMTKPKTACDVCGKQFINVAQHKTKTHEKHVIVIHRKSATLSLDGNSDETPSGDMSDDDDNEIMIWYVDVRGTGYEVYWCERTGHTWIAADHGGYALKGRFDIRYDDK